MGLELTAAEEAQLQEIQAGQAAVFSVAADVGSKEQAETSERLQVAAQDAEDDFWREIAARRIPGVRDELHRWMAWRRDTGGRPITGIEP